MRRLPAVAIAIAAIAAAFAPCAGWAEDRAPADSPAAAAPAAPATPATPVSPASPASEAPAAPPAAPAAAAPPAPAPAAAATAAPDSTATPGSPETTPAQGVAPAAAAAAPAGVIGDAPTAAASPLVADPAAATSVAATAASSAAPVEAAAAAAPAAPAPATPAAPEAAPIAAATAAAAEAPRPSKPLRTLPLVGVSVGGGFPDLANLNLLVRPLDWFRVYGGPCWGYVSWGVQGGIVLSPINWYINPTLSFQAGTLFRTNLSRFLKNDNNDTKDIKPLLEKVDYKYFAGDLGVELGSPRSFTFFLRFGLSFVVIKANGTASHTSDDGSRVSITDPKVSAWLPSAKLGFQYWF